MLTTKVASRIRQASISGPHVPSAMPGSYASYCTAVNTARAANLQCPNAYTFLQRDLALPGSFCQTQCLDAVLPPRAPALSSPQVLQQLLPPVDQQPQVALVVLVALAASGQEIGHRLDLGGQNGYLHF